MDSSTTCCCSGKLEEGRAQAKVLVGEAARAGARQEAFLHTRVMLWLCFLPLGLPATSLSPVRVRRQEALVGCPKTSGRLPTWL